MLAAGAAMASSLLACAVCYGDPTSPLSEGARAGVLILLGVITFVLGWIVTIMVIWIRRARMLEASEAFDRKRKAKVPVRLFEGEYEYLDPPGAPVR